MKNPFRMHAFVLVFALFAGGVMAQSGSLDGRLDQQNQKLKQIQKEIQSHRLKAQELRREEKSVVEQLGTLDREIALSIKLVSAMEERALLLEEQIDSLRLSISVESEMLEYQRRKLSGRLRQMYKRGSSARWELLLASTDFHDALRRYKFLGLIAERDASLVSEVKERKARLEQEQATLTEAMADVVAMKTARVEEDAQLHASKRGRVVVLDRIRGEKSQHAQAIGELKRSQEKLKDLIDNLERKRLADGDADLPTGNFASLRGKLGWPVRGKLSKRFGNERHPKFGTVTFNNGINIKAGEGSPIRAVAAGRVDFVDWIAGYGNCIIVNHGGSYYTLYAHASAIFVDQGQDIAANDVIAEVGDTGSLNGFECHFEVRRAKEALDPLLWLKKK